MVDLEDAYELIHNGVLAQAWQGGDGTGVGGAESSRSDQPILAPETER